MLTSFTALILGLVEGLTEFLPISSTAHLILATHVLGLTQSAVVKTFEIAIQSGAILAVIVLYWRKLLDVEILKRIITAFIPTAVIGFALYGLVKTYLIGNIVVVLWALGLGGIVLILFEKFFHKVAPEETSGDLRTIGYGQSALIGLAQVAALIPGVSRSAATIIGGLFCGLKKETIVEFSFLLSVPTILAATGYDLFRNADAFSANDIGMLAIGFGAAFVAALIAIKFFLSYLKKHTFMSFGIYRILIVLVFVAVLYF